MTRPLPTRGIHVQTAMGWLLSRLLEDSSDPVPFAYEGAGPHRFGGGSQNMKLLYAVVGYVGGAEDGRQRLLNYYRTEDQDGHGGGEILTVSHDQLHLGGHAAAALHAPRKGDAAVLDCAVSWLQVRYALLTACALDGEPWTAGARGVQREKVVGENKARGAFLAAIGEGKKPRKTDQFFLGALAAAALPSEIRERIAKPPREWPSMQGGLEIKRWADGRFYCRFESLPLKGGGVRAAGFDGTEKWIEREGMPPERLAAYPEDAPALTIRAELPRGRTEV